MTNRFSRVMAAALIAAGLVVMIGAVAVAEDISPTGDPTEAQPTPAEVPAPTAEGAEADPAAAPAPGEQAAPEAAPPPATQESSDGGSGFTKMLPLLLGAMVLMWIFAGRKSRKADKARKGMLADLKKGDKVTSIGGIVGTAIDVREHEVVVKVDETSNTRMRFARWAIRSVGTTPAEDSDAEIKK